MLVMFFYAYMYITCNSLYHIYDIIYNIIYHNTSCLIQYDDRYTIQ
jgi:hypothetical protein